MFNDIELLSAAGGSKVFKVTGLPTWVPDWSADWTQILSIQLLEFKNYVGKDDVLQHVNGRADVHRKFKAAGNSRFHAKFSKDKTQFWTQGFILDQIKVTGGYFPRSFETPKIFWKDSSTDEAAQAFCDLDVLEEWQNLISLHSKAKYLTDEDMIDVYVQTINGGIQQNWKRDRIRVDFLYGIYTS